jgi:hypothetical protein
LSWSPLILPKEKERSELSFESHLLDVSRISTFMPFCLDFLFSAAAGSTGPEVCFGDGREIRPRKNAGLNEPEPLLGLLSPLPLEG